MKRRRAILPILVSLVLVALAGCGDDEGPTAPGGSLDLTFTGDASFHGAHGDQAIHVFVVHSGGTVVASEDGTVSSSAEPAFSFTFQDVLAEGESYDLNYWIDSNFGGGTQGECDAPEVDHQWKIDVGPVSDDVTIADTHRPTETEQVCSDTEENPGEPGY